jgi:hypothetical protein
MFLAIAKAVEDAKKNLVKIPLNGQSVPHEQKVNLVVHVYFNSCLMVQELLLELFVQFLSQ